MSNRRGRLFILSAPSGAGKTTVARRVVETTGGVGISRSYTSRPARAGERDGVDYNFVSVDRFRQLRDAGAFLEWAEVFGDFYGTGASDTQARLAAGDDLVLVIDVQGARKVRQAGVPSVGIFLMPPSYAVLEERLRGRGRDPEAAILRRLVIAREEIRAFVEYRLRGRQRRDRGVRGPREGDPARRTLAPRNHGCGGRGCRLHVCSAAAGARARSLRTRVCRRLRSA